MSSKVGLSIHAFGDLVRRGAGYVVEKLNSLASVDLVSEPGSTLSLFESRSLERIFDHPLGLAIDALQFPGVDAVSLGVSVKARDCSESFFKEKNMKLDREAAALLETLPLKNESETRGEIAEALASEPNRDEKRLLAAISKM